MSLPVSILILTYNHVQYIAQAIESVLMQKTSFSFEILIGDDGSTDGTALIVEEYAKKYSDKIKNYSTGKNIGALKNEQHLMQNASGKYIALLEGDDFWTDEYKLQKQVDFLEENPDYGLTHSDVNHYYENTGHTEYHVNRLNGLNVLNGFIFNALIAPDPLFIKTATVCFRRDLMLTHFDYELAIKENWPLTDFPLWMDIAFHSKVYYMDEVFATYRLLNESASRTASPVKKLHFHNGLYNIKQTYITKYNCAVSVKQAIDENYYRGLLKIAYNLSDSLLAQKAINYFRIQELKINLNEKLLALGAKHKPVKCILNFIRNKP